MKKQKEFPLEIKISFQKIIEWYTAQLEGETSTLSKVYTERMLRYVSEFPALSEGIENVDDLVKYKDPIRILMKDFFPEILSRNQIKAISIPFHNVVFNSTAQFKDILKSAGEAYSLSMRNVNPNLDYIFGCIMILNTHYGYDIDFSRPLYYDIPDEQGIIRHYRIDLNSDFGEIKPVEAAPEVSEEDVDILLQQIEDVHLWKKKFPPKSWIFKGFTIITLTDVTVDDAISELKTTLLQRNSSGPEDLNKFEEIFRSIYKIPDLQVGFTIYNDRERCFERMGGRVAPSFILQAENLLECSHAIPPVILSALRDHHNYFTISNVEKFSQAHPDDLFSKNLLRSNIKSSILAPIAKHERLLGVLEIASPGKNDLNSVNATKLEDILPYIVTAVERNRVEFENQVKAVIQSECTSIHPSVLWIFEKEARKFIRDLEEDGLASFKDISFENVHPLYGQIDIIASSEARNGAIQRDLLEQLQMIRDLIMEAQHHEKLDLFEQLLFRITAFQKTLQSNLNASSEQKVFNLLQREINPVLEHIEHQLPHMGERVRSYREKVNSDTGIIYNHRKDYDAAVQQINRTMARYIDRRQVEAQKLYPHYFERYKTDGVEHNMYIGRSLIHPGEVPFDKVYLYNLRLWQLKTMCAMENLFYRVQEDMPLKLEAASLILVFNATLSIRYRMDEKKLDVDGAYNARYEIIKKRIDKAAIKGSSERITQKGKITIIYTAGREEREYLRYVEYLQAKAYLGEKVELLELEDLQGVVGLKAIRVEVLYRNEEETGMEEPVISYDDLELRLGKVVRGKKANHRKNDPGHKNVVRDPK